MAETLSLIKAVQRHLLLPDESTGKFATMYKALTPEDKAQLRTQFATEFGYIMEEPKAA